MSDNIKHECGIAFIRLLKPFAFYKEKYGTSRYGLLKMNQLMQKLVNRGQDGAGVATLKLNMPSGFQNIDRIRSAKSKAVDDIFFQINESYHKARKEYGEKYNDLDWQKNNMPFMGELVLGHLRYGTFGKNEVENCHPFSRSGKSKLNDLILAGNFNLTNISDLALFLNECGCHYENKADTVTLMETIGYFLDKEISSHKEKYNTNSLQPEEQHISIRDKLDICSILKESSKNWDGGYVMGGIFGNGDAFLMRDPSGIRPAYCYNDDEVIVIASERPVIQTVFDVKFADIQELKPGYAAIVKANGQYSHQEIKTNDIVKPCSFERIYFSRGNDAEIYNERRTLGKNLASTVLNAINNDLENTVFSYIPNTAEAAFEGLIEGVHQILDDIKVSQLQKLGVLSNTQAIKEIISKRPRIRKVIIKDVKQRTFITDDNNRNEMVNQVYDITYNTIKENKDTLVILDDSIVRGTTLKKSILSILDRLKPKKIIVVSSAPQIRYPDCYGVDMSVLTNFVAFEATIELIKEKEMESTLEKLYQETLEEIKKPSESQKNILQEIYQLVGEKEVSQKITKIVKPMHLQAELEIIFQSVEGLNSSCPNNAGDWYFTGNYPTCGGNKVVNQALINYFENRSDRPY